MGLWDGLGAILGQRVICMIDRFTAVVNSIDRSTENRAPNRCLPFDGIGARHPGIVASSGNTTANGNLVPAPGVIRDAEPQYHQKVNNDLGLYSL